MATAFPGAVDSFPDPVGTDLLDNATALLKHATQHTNVNDAVNAIETQLNLTGLLTGSGVPGAGLGVNTNLYLDTASGIIYRKTAGTWAAIYTPSGGASGEGFSENLGGTAFNTYNRKLPANNTSYTAGNGLLLVAVTAPISILAAKIKVYLTGGGSASPTVSQLGLYSLNSSGDGTLIGSTSSTSVFTGTGLISTNLSVAVNVTAGSRYAVGYIQSNGTGPTFLGLANGGSSQGALASLNPWVFAVRGTGGTSPVPASFVYASLAAPLGYPEFYAEISA